MGHYQQEAVATAIYILFNKIADYFRKSAMKLST